MWACGCWPTRLCHGVAWDNDRTRGVAGAGAGGGGAAGADGAIPARRWGLARGRNRSVRVSLRWEYASCATPEWECNGPLAPYQRGYRPFGVTAARTVSGEVRITNL